MAKSEKNTNHGASAITTESQEKLVRIYSPDNRFGSGALTAARALWDELATHRSHIFTLFGANFRNTYRGTALGVFWNFALPLLPVSVYIFLAKLKVFPEFQSIPREVYIPFNVTVWFLMTDLITTPMKIIKSKTAMVTKTAIPLSAFIASAFAETCFEALVRLALIIVMMIITKTVPAVTAPLMLVALFAAFLFCFGAGLILSILNAAFPDVERVVSIFLRYGIFLSGVIFPLSSLGPAAILETINPLAVFIQASRDLTFEGGVTHMLPFFSYSLLGVVLFVTSLRLFYIMEFRIRGLA